MNVQDIPQDMLDGIKMRFESTQEVRQLRTKQQYFHGVGKYREALELAKTLEHLYTVYLNSYMEKAEKEVGTLDTETADIPRKDKDEMIEKLMVLFMACDLIDSAVIDLNNILHRSKPDIDITAFDDIRQTSDMARKKLEYLNKTGDYMKDLVWAERCDDMYEMINNKAKSIIRRRKENKDWGKNMEIS